MTAADPLAGLRAYLTAGHTLRDAAAVSGIPHTTLFEWLRRGLPKKATQVLRLQESFTADGRTRRHRE